MKRNDVRWCQRHGVRGSCRSAPVAGNGRQDGSSRSARRVQLVSQMVGRSIGPQERSDNAARWTFVRLPFVSMGGLFGAGHSIRMTKTVGEYRNSRRKWRLHRVQIAESFGVPQVSLGSALTCPPPQCPRHFGMARPSAVASGPIPRKSKKCGDGSAGKAIIFVRGTLPELGWTEARTEEWEVPPIRRRGTC